VCIDVRYGSSSVESPDNLLEIIKGMRGSPSVESPGNLCEMKALDKGLSKSVI
jgi:hypothetical protein